MARGIVVDSVVEVARTWRKDLLDFSEDILDQPALVLVTNYCGSSVRGMHQAQACLNIGVGNDLLDASRQVNELVPLPCGHCEYLRGAFHWFHEVGEHNRTGYMSFERNRRKWGTSPGAVSVTELLLLVWVLKGALGNVLASSVPRQCSLHSVFSGRPRR